MEQMMLVLDVVKVFSLKAFQHTSHLALRWCKRTKKCKGCFMESINPDCFIKIQLIDFEYCHILVIYFLAFNLENEYNKTFD